MRPRKSRIFYEGKYYDYPIKPMNALLNLGPVEAVRCVLSYLADNSLTFAGGSVLGDSVVTMEHKINYLRPAKGEGCLIATAVVVDAGENQAVCRCEIHVDDGKERTLCAAGQGTIRKLR